MSVTKILLSRVPPSVNAMYRNLPGKGRVKTTDYKNWIKFSQVEVLIQRARRHLSRVEVAIRLPEAQIRKNSDGDNRIKSVMDLLVSQGIIIDDSRDFVRKTSVEFADIEETEITVTDVEAPCA